MNKKIVLIQSHCNSEEKKYILLKNINKLKEYDVDILLFSHIPLPIDIISKVDFFIYDSTNPILWEERRHYYWWGCDKYKIESTVPDYGWTVFNQIIKGFNIVKDENYEHFYIFCYDTIIDDTIINSLKNPSPSFYVHHKPEDYDENGNLNTVVLGAALIFSIFNKYQINQLVSSISKEEYSNNYGMIAEKYFEEKLKTLSMYNQTNKIVRDYLHESKNIFNLSKNNDYNLFIDNQKYLKFIFKNNTLDSQKIIINNDIIEVNSQQEILFDESYDEIKNLGILLKDNSYEDWISMMKENKINIITFNK
jgi:hypothetical protein